MSSERAVDVPWPEPPVEPRFEKGEYGIYNIASPVDARDYLGIEFNHILPVIRDRVDLNRAMDHVPRAARFKGGRRQTVAEHTANLRTMGEALADRYTGIVKPFLTEVIFVHDGSVEVYGDDTEIGDCTARATKDPREFAGLTIFGDDLGESHPLVRIARGYHNEENHLLIPEFLICTTDDKNEASEFQIAEAATLHRQRKEEAQEKKEAGEKVEEETIEDVLGNTLAKTVLLDVAYGRARRNIRILAENWRQWVDPDFTEHPAALTERLHEDAMRELARAGMKQLVLAEMLAGRTNADRDALRRIVGD